MKDLKDIIEPKGKSKGFAIKTAAAKQARKEKISQFVSKYGRGDKGLTEAQKTARIEKFIGKSNQIEKVKGMGSNKSQGIELKNKLKISKHNIDEDHKEVFDPIDQDLIKNLDQYPKDLRAGKNKDGSDQDMRIVFAECKDNGEMEIHHIHKDGKEHDPLIRSMTGVIIMDDENAARNEAKQYKKGDLKEVSDRTMALFEDAGILDQILEDDSIVTDEDKELQI